VEKNLPSWGPKVELKNREWSKVSEVGI
jgi:hypothetical protein